MYLLHMQRWSLLALTFGAALLSYSAFAEQQANEPPVVWGLGVGVLAAEQPLKINSEWLLSLWARSTRSSDSETTGSRDCLNYVR